MGKLFKVLGIFIGVVLLLLVAAIVVLPMVVDPNDFKGEIVERVQKQTGRDLKIAGDLNLSVFPWLGVKVDGVELGNAKGFGKTPFASIKRAAVRVKLMPLLDKKLEVDTVELEGVALNLAKKSDGTSNWDDLAKGDQDEEVTDQSKEKSESSLESFTIGGINIKDANISWTDDQSGKKYQISDFNMKSGAIVPGNPVALNMGMLLQSNEPAVNARIGLDGTIELDQPNKQLNVRDLALTLDAEGGALPQGKLKGKLESVLLLALDGRAFALLDLKVNSGALNLTGDIKGAKLNSDTPQFSGKIAIAEFSPRDWMASQGMEPPVMADPNALSKLAATLNLSSSGMSTKINKLAIKLDDSTINGNAVIQGSATAFQLNVDEINLDRYMSADSGKGSSAPSNTQERETSANNQLFPVDTIRNLDMSGTVNIEKLTVNKLPAQKVALTLKARNGLLQTTQKIGAFSGGSYNGTTDINASGKTPSIKITSNLSGVELQSLVKQLAGEDRLSGQGNFKANLTASGNNINAIKRSLNGTMSFNLLKGAIKGINLAAELRKAKALLSGESAPAEKGPVQTDFSQIKGSGVITKGVLSNKDLEAFSPFLRVTGSGLVNLVRERVDYTAKIFVVETSKGQGGYNLAGLEELERKKIGVPVRFTGPLASPKWTVKWDQVLLESQKEELKSKLEEKLIGEEKEGEEESDKDKLKRKLLRKILR
jgi:AsmA protein